jgi:dihydroorotate dehydrogenase
VRGGWINQIGFRNPGIRSITTFNSHCIYSISAIEPDVEWPLLHSYIPAHVNLELNLSCPNINKDGTLPPGISLPMLEKFLAKFPNLIVKTRPEPNTNIEDMIRIGLKNVHMSNTIAAKKGGISGSQLKKINLPLIHQNFEWNTFANFAWGMDVTIIAGGGIYTKQDVIDYRNAGADDFSISTAWITKPWNVKEIYNEATTTTNHIHRFSRHRWHKYY